MSKLDIVIAGINKKFKNNIIGDKDNVTFNKKGVIPFVSPSFTYLFHGGLPTNSLLEVSGGASSGKSTFCFSVAGQAQKKFKQDWQEEVDRLTAIDKPNQSQKARLAELLDNGHKRVVYLDAEHSADKEWMIKNGVDIDDIIFIFPQEESAEQLLQTTLELAETDQIGLLIIDSLATLVSQQAFDKTLEEKSYCGIAGVLTTWSAKVLPMLTKYDMTVICINQERDVINSQYAQTSTPGGRAFKFACHARLAFRKGRYLDDSYKEVPNGVETSFGASSSVQVLKNKLTKPDRKLIDFTITYDNGIDYWNDLFSLAVTMKIIRQSGTWFDFPALDNNDETYIDNEGNPVKFQGKNRFLQYMHNNQYFTELLLKIVNEEISQ